MAMTSSQNLSICLAWIDSWPMLSQGLWHLAEGLLRWSQSAGSGASQMKGRRVLERGTGGSGR